MYDLLRFAKAQEHGYERALAEIERGMKTSHWVWYIFPQVKGLGFSEKSRWFGIEDLGEARAYLNDPTLGPRYVKCVNALLSNSEIPIKEIMGPLDAKKLQSSLTLMLAASGGEIVQKAIDEFYDGKICEKTMQILSR
ncbi:DUF1810 domain-containing protein [Ruegeria arenilitoris]|uniref:DUF1810 domain-containing protein n=1 Tax=Ruegeria arenilitoris TaxID=1173585 RepID=UPI00147AC3B2|nr:DUF1810 domain-containing protein [Ruegeria arenilitoris]